MRIKLKQYEQLQQLTTMLQESHKSLVTTNEHLLKEINDYKPNGKEPLRQNIDNFLLSSFDCPTRPFNS
jgi:centrosomal protein CEP72